MAAPSVRHSYPLWGGEGGVVALNILHVIIGIATGIISGFGIGGGSILVLYLTTALGTSQYVAGGINLLYFISCAPIALIGHSKNRRIQWRTALWCIGSGILFTIPTALLANHLDSGWLRRLFGILLLYIGIRELRTGAKKNNR